MTIGIKKYSVDWNGNDAFGDANEDISDDVIGPFQTYRGRNKSSQLQGRSLAGTLRMVLNNEDDKYSSFNTSSPIFGNILPGRKVGVETNDSFPYTFPIVFAGTPIWTGYLKVITPQVLRNGRKIALLEAVGSLGMLRKKVSTAMQTSIVTSDAIDDILDALAWASGKRDIQTGKTTMQRHWVDDQDGFFALRDVEETEFGFLWEKANGDIAFADRHFRMTNTRSMVSQSTLSDAAAAALQYSEPLKQQNPLPQIFNFISAKVPNYTVGGETDLWTLAESGANSPKIEPGETRIWWATYSAGVDAWTTLVENTDYEANTQAGGGGDDKSGILTVVQVPFGGRLKISVTNTDIVNVYQTLLKARGTPLTKSDPAEVTDQDATSIAAYGERSYPLPAKFIPDTDEARDYCGFILGIYKDPIPGLRIAMVANKDQNHYAAAITREINDRVTVVATGRAGLGINEDFYVEAIRHIIGEDKVHWVVFDLSPVAAFGGFWILGIGILGASTRLIY